MLRRLKKGVSRNVMHHKDLLKYRIIPDLYFPKRQREIGKICKNLQRLVESNVQETNVLKLGCLVSDLRYTPRYNSILLDFIKKY